MLSKGTMWQGWNEDLLHLIWPAAVNQSTKYHEVNPWAVQCSCLSSWCPSIDTLHRCNEMFGFLRALQAHLCQEFGSSNDVRPCIQPHTTNSFPNTAGFVFHSLVTKLHRTALQDLWGWPTWWKMHGWCCTGPVVVTLDQQFMQKHAW